MNKYIDWILKNNKLVLSLSFIIVLGLVSQIYKFELDASSDSLVLENDASLRYYQEVKSHYGSDDALVISYTPKDDLLSDKTLSTIKDFSQKLEKISQVKSITSILTVPLLQSPPLSLIELAVKQISLGKNNADKKLAKVELSNSPLYGSNLVSKDGKTTAILVSLKNDKKAEKLRKNRDDLRLKKFKKGLNDTEKNQLALLEKSVSYANKIKNIKQSQTIAQVRSVMKKYNKEGAIFLGGLPMIVNDVVAYVKNDLVVFSLAVILVMALVLGIIFKALRWVVVPIFISLLVGFTMTGVLSALGWKVTVISSNYFSMLLVMTLSIIIHLVVRNRELNLADSLHKQTLKETMVSMAKPCLYTTLTTVIAFGSLIVSGIRPVIDFGLMMSLGVVMALIFSFVIFPVIVSLLPKLKIKEFKKESSFTHKIAEFVEHKTIILWTITLFFVVLSLIGVFNLKVDNSFINYFKQDTEVYQGLSDIDKHLGGTTPLEIIIDDVAQDYWYDKFLRKDIHKLHTYLDSLEETGKVLSVDTFMQILTQANNGKALTGFFLNIARANVSKEVKQQILNPYISEQTGQIRLVIRIKESNPNLNRDVFLKKVRKYIVDDLGFKSNSVHLTGMIVLFNNMLQSLFDSQIKTMGFVFITIFLMFSLIFRSFYLAILTVVPNMLPAFLVLGIMGIMGIPLDLMTITIAAIAIGIGVDDAIHYVHRFKKEFKLDKNYLSSMYRTHQSSGLAMFYTSIVISFGFLVLVLSNFIPSIYFGIFTAIAMMSALLINLIILPKLLIWLKPKI